MNVRILILVMMISSALLLQGLAHSQLRSAVAVDVQAEVDAVMIASFRTQQMIERQYDEKLEEKRLEIEALRTQISGLSASDQRRPELLSDLAMQQAEFVAELAKRDAEYAMKIEEFRLSVEHLASYPEARKILNNRTAGALTLSRARLDDLVERLGSENTSGGEYITNLRAIASLAADDLGYGEATSQELLQRHQKIVSLDPGSYADQYKVALYAFQSGDSDKALQAIDKAKGLTISPADRAEVESLKAKIALKSGQFDLAIASIENVLDERKSLAQNGEIGALMELQSALTTVADARAGMMQIGLAARYYEQAMDVSRQIQSLQPNSDALKYDLTRSIYSFIENELAARMMGAGNKRIDLLELNQEARSIQSSALSDAPNSLKRLDEAYALFAQADRVSEAKSGMMAMFSGLSAERRRLLEQQLDIARKRAAADPDRAQFQLDVRNLEQRLGVDNSSNGTQSGHQETLNILSMTEQEQIEYMQKQTQKAQSAAMKDVQRQANLDAELRAQGIDPVQFRQAKTREIRALKSKSDQAQMSGLMGGDHANAVAKLEAILLEVRDKTGSPPDKEWGRLQAEILGNIGVVTLMSQDMAKAAEAYERQTAFLEELVRTYPEDASFRRDLESAQRDALQFKAFDQGDFFSKPF